MCYHDKGMMAYYSLEWRELEMKLGATVVCLPQAHWYVGRRYPQEDQGDLAMQGASLLAWTVKNLPAVRETQV